MIRGWDEGYLCETVKDVPATSLPVIASAVPESFRVGILDCLACLAMTVGRASSSIQQGDSWRVPHTRRAVS